MDTCTNCGATLRPGAKFCTTCGTRLNETPPANDGWNTTRTDSESESQQTTVLNAVQPPSEQPESPRISESRQRSADAWTSAYGSENPSAEPKPSSDDPASRFISALDNEVRPASGDDAGTESTKDPASTWNTAAPAFTPPPPSNWNYDAASDTPAVEESPASESTAKHEAEESTVDDNWVTPSTWGTPQESDDDESETAEEQTVDSAGFTDDGADEVDYLSGDENIEVSGESTPVLPPDEARDKAIALADELRRTIRMMGSGGESDHGAAVMALTEASLKVGDFSDVRGVLADVKNDPRDIQSLTSLAGKVDRIEELLDEQKRLVDSIELAIKELNG